MKLQSNWQKISTFITLVFQNLQCFAHFIIIFRKFLTFNRLFFDEFVTEITKIASKGVVVVAAGVAMVINHAAVIMAHVYSCFTYLICRLVAPYLQVANCVARGMFHLPAPSMLVTMSTISKRTC